MTVAIYTRISRDDIGDGLGVQRQEEDCLALASRRGLHVRQVLCDNDVSAFSGKNRPGYQRLLDTIRQGQTSHVLAWAPERLHRSPRELEDFLELIERHNVQVETVKAGTWDVSTSHGRLVARMLGAVSRAESERTGERVSRAHQQAKANGRWRGPIPYGMRAGPVAGLPEVDDEQAQVIRGIADRLLRGDALTRIAADLNAAGVRPRRGVAWTHTGVRRLLESPALGGLVRVDDELRAAAFAGVVDAATWRSIQASIRSRPRGEARRPREKLTLLGGIMVCAKHGYICVGSSATHGAIYCAAAAGQCHVMIKREPVDRLVTATVIRRLQRPDALHLFEAPDVDLHGEERTELQQRRDDIAALLGDGLLPASTARTELERLAARLAALEQPNRSSMDATELVRASEAAWQTMSQVQRRQVLRVLFESISLVHVGASNGPRVDLRRVVLKWRTEPLNRRGQGGRAKPEFQRPL